MKTKRKYLFFMLPLFLIVACSEDSTSSSNDFSLVDEWQVVGITRNNEVFNNTQDDLITIDFTMDVDFSGMTNVNIFSGTYTVSGTTLEINSLTTTEVAETGFGAEFFRALDASRQGESNIIEFRFETVENTLVLRSQNTSFRLERVVVP